MAIRNRDAWVVEAGRAGLALALAASLVPALVAGAAEPVEAWAADSAFTNHDGATTSAVLIDPS